MSVLATEHSFIDTTPGLRQQTLVVGLGKSGRSVVRFLSARGVPLLAADTRGSPPELAQLRREYPELEIHLGPLERDLCAAVGRIILSPGLSREHPVIHHAVEMGVEVVGDVELFAQLATAPIVAITGSNGKSTVTTLVAEMAANGGLEARAGGNLGTPVLELLGQTEPDLYVIELSSFQLETTTSLAPLAAVVLNVTPDHMDRYHDLESYAETKGTIYRHAAHIIHDADNRMVSTLIKRRESSAELISYRTAPSLADHCYGICRGAGADGGEWLCRGEKLLMPLDELRIAGRHNHSNALAALALGEAAGVPLSSMVETLKVFRGLPHRTEWVAESGEVRWINDSKGTNVGATEAAISGLLADSPHGASKIVLIAGGQGKGADFSPLRTLAANTLRAAVLMGEDAELISAALDGVVPEIRVDGMEQAVAVAHGVAESGDTVLLSPACASFDQFSGFEGRGERFKAEVHQLLGESP